MDLRDLRAKITDRAEIIREFMHEWSTRQIDVARLLLRRLSVEGIAGRESDVKGSG